MPPATSEAKAGEAAEAASLGGVPRVGAPQGLGTAPPAPVDAPSPVRQAPAPPPTEVQGGRQLLLSVQQHPVTLEEVAVGIIGGRCVVP